MNWAKTVPQWDNTGSEPPAGVKTAGFVARDKPPAAWINWFFNAMVQLFTELRTFLNLSTLSTGQMLIFDGAKLVTVSPDALMIPLCVPGYLSNDASDIAGYKTLQYNNPYTNLADLVNANTNANTDNLIASFATAPGRPGIPTLEVGDWAFNIQAKVDNAAGTNNLFAKVYKRDTAGVETLLFTTANGVVASTAFANIQFAYTVAAGIALAAGERIVVKLYGRSTAAGRVFTARIAVANTSYFAAPWAKNLGAVYGN